MTRNSNLELYRNSNLRAGQVEPSWWTGKSPVAGVCPGVDADGKIHSLAMPNLARCTRQTILDYFDNTWALTEVLFSALQTEEAFYRAPYHQLRHPMIFYYCHPAVLYVNKLRVAGLISDPVNAYFEQLFETGVDEMSWDDLSKNTMDWPRLQEATAYRAKVYALVCEIIMTHPGLDQASITPSNPLWAFFMAFEHERIHLETSSVLIRELPIEFVRKPAQWPDYFPLGTINQPHNQFIEQSGGVVQLGKPVDWPSYGWDNEYGSREINVNAFRATQFLISNAEFREFVIDNGYQKQRYWSEEGWQWRTFRNAKWPTFWVPDGPAGLHQYKLRLCFDMVPMQDAWAVNVNYHEAKAYCAWRSERDYCAIPYRLLTEAEHHRLRDDDMGGQNNISLAYASESAVNAGNATQAGFYDVFGNVWQWCEDHFAALPGFEIHSLYDDFSTPCFDGKHNIIMGGSFMSTGDEAGCWARFHFRRHFFQHAGFRLVQPLNLEEHLATSCLDAPSPHVGGGACCSRHKKDARENQNAIQHVLSQSLLLHYGSLADTTSFSFLSKEVMQFPVRTARLLCDLMRQHGIAMTSVLDLGCAVGGASFELTRHFSNVVGIDLDRSLIEAAIQLQQTGMYEFSYVEEGELLNVLQAHLDPVLDKSRVHFQVGDACALPADLGEFDAVLMSDLLCHLPSPKSCLSRMSGARGLVRMGGLLLIASPYSWQATRTPKAAWLGGKNKGDDAITSFEGLRATLEMDFELIHETNMPSIIREHARKFEYNISHVTVWRRVK